MLDEILRQMNCSKFPKTEHEVAHKLHDLYVYSGVGKSLESDAISQAVLKSLKVIADEIPPPGKRQGTLWLFNAHIDIFTRFVILVISMSLSKQRFRSNSSKK